MNIWSIVLAVLLLCYLCDVVFSRRCYSDDDCEGFCCSGMCTKESYCLCMYDSDCKVTETCYRNSCRKPFGLTTTAYPTFSLEPVTERYECVWDSECSDSQICEKRKCVHKRDIFSWGSSGVKVTAIVVFVTMATIISCLYHICRRVRKQRLLQPPQQSPSTEMALNNTTSVELGSSHPTNVAVVEVEEFPLPPGAPPPYSSLVFNAERELPSEAPPPSYDEALRTSQMGTA